MDPQLNLCHNPIYKTCPSVNLRCWRAAELMVRHKAAIPRYNDVLTKFVKDPRMETLVAVRGALIKALYDILILCLISLIIACL